MARTYRVAVLGCGGIAGRNDSLRGWVPGRAPLSHAGAFRSHPRTELVAAADPDPVRLEEFGRTWGIRALYADYRSLLQREAVEIISICAPTSLHARMVEDAVARGAKALLCEKPLAANLSEAVRASTAAHQHGVTLLVNYGRRWNAALRELAHELQRGAWGAVRRVSVYYPGGIVSNGTHALDLIRWLVGEIAVVKALSVLPHEQLDPPLDALCRTDSGVPCLLQSCNPADFSLLEMDILTERGRVRVSTNGRQIERARAEADPYFAGYRLLSTSEVRPTDWEEALMRTVEDLVECLESGRKPLCGGEEAVKALRAAAAVMLSARRDGAEVPLASLPICVPSDVKGRG